MSTRWTTFLHKVYIYYIRYWNKDACATPLTYRPKTVQLEINHEEDIVQEYEFSTLTKNSREILQSGNDLWTTAMFPFTFTVPTI